MLDGFAEWASTGAVPVWAVVAGAVAIVGGMALRRAALEGSGVPLLRGALIAAAVVAGWGALDQIARRNLLLAQQQAFDARALDLTARALAPGSALACLDAIAGEAVEEACEKALFASPEATAAAVSYVAAKLALLAWANDHAQPASASSSSSRLRRAIETDRFGVAAHVLAERDGCTPDRCAALALLHDPSRVRVNLADRPFDAFVKRYAAAWPTSGTRPVAANPQPAVPAASAPPMAAAVTPGGPPKSPNNLYFPSSNSIPPVNIMTAEPAPPQPHATTGANETPARKPAASPPQPRQQASPSAAPTRAAPIQLAPAQ